MNPTIRKVGAAVLLRPEVRYWLRLPNGFPHRFDYRYDLESRWGFSRPPHELLQKQIDAHQANYGALLQSMAAQLPDFLKIAYTLELGIEPAWDNAWLPALDGMAIYHFLVSRKPKLYREVGSGNSTKFAHRARRDHSLATQLVSIDPQPRAEIDSVCDEVVRQPLENADLSVFSRLQRGDVLFIDNSHRAFTNSDVTVFFLDVLPRLPDGVIVGIHDICLPFDYPPSWRYRYYNEQYLLACYLLAQRSGLQVRLPSHYLSQKWPELMEPLRPLWSAQPNVPPYGCAFWLETAR